MERGMEKSGVRRVGDLSLSLGLATELGRLINIFNL